MVATLTLLPDARHFNAGSLRFLAVAMPQSGMVLDRAVDAEEDLASPGIDYQRWRTIFAQFPVTEAFTITDCATFSAAIDLARLHAEASARLAHLVILYGTRSITYRNIKILRATPIALPGAVSGSGVTGSPLAAVRTAWQWRCTEDAT